MGGKHERGKVGFIGVGNMGGPMALNLVKAGRQLVVHDVRPDALKPFGNKIQVAASPAEVASVADIVLVSLPRPEIVHGVVFGDNGIASGSKRKIFVDLSTTGPRMARIIATISRNMASSRSTARSRAASRARSRARSR